MPCGCPASTPTTTVTACPGCHNVECVTLFFLCSGALSFGGEERMLSGVLDIGVLVVGFGASKDLFHNPELCVSRKSC